MEGSEARPTAACRAFQGLRLWAARIFRKGDQLSGIHNSARIERLLDRAQRHMPIVFSTGDSVVPLALAGLNEGVNVFVDDEGKAHQPFYVPAYVRRYPYFLARLDQNAQELSLCFDTDSELVGDDPDGTGLFEEE